MSSDAPVFDKGPAGRRISAERYDEPGREHTPSEESDDVYDEDEPRVKWDERKPDTLWHPQRLDDGTTFRWNPFRPRGA